VKAVPEPLPVGKNLVATAAIADAVDASDSCRGFVRDCVRRFRQGDDGDLGTHDKRVNREALKDGSRILASYELPAGRRWGPDQRIWIITDAADSKGVRHTTTILWPSDY
jgi:hypothetical protein